MKDGDFWFFDGLYKWIYLYDDNELFYGPDTTGDMEVERSIMSIGNFIRELTARPDTYTYIGNIYEEKK